MIGRTLFVYFLRRYLGTLAQFVIGVVLISFLVDFTEFSRRTAGLEAYTVPLALASSAMRVPLILQTAIPFTVLFACMATLSSLNRRYELVVTRASGVSAWQFLAPLCAASLGIGIFMTAVFNPIAAKALDRAQEIEAMLFAGGNAPPSEDGLPWLRQKTDEGVTIIGAKRTAKRGKFLVGPTFLRLDEDGTIMERIDAKNAVLTEGAWFVSFPTIYRQGENPVSQRGLRIKTDLTPAFVEESLAAPELIPFYELPRKIAASRSFGLSGNAFATHFHSLMALPVLLVAMTLIAATVTMRFARMGQSVMIILGGILAGFLLYVVTVLVKAFGSAGFVPPIAAAWFPVLVAGFFGVTFLLYKEDG